MKLKYTPLQRFVKFCKYGKTYKDCIEWRGHISVQGYGLFYVLNQRFTAHRWLYLNLIGLQDLTLVIDHLCQNRKCVNLLHLEPVTTAENVKRAARVCKLKCSKGHPLTPETQYIYGNRRHCKQCSKNKGKQYRREIKYTNQRLAEILYPM